jgi:hypothetical protein
VHQKELTQMGSNNIQQFNGGQVNTESDAQYTADVLRTGGALTGGLFPSPTANKMFYQWSTFLAALAQSLANKGYTISDANLASLTAVLANVITEADLGQALVTVTFASSIAFDASTISPRVGAFQLTLTGNVTPTTLANTTAGQVLIFIVIQDGTGGHTFAWPSSVTGGVVINALRSRRSSWPPLGPLSRLSQHRLSSPRRISQAICWTPYIRTPGLLRGG